MAVVIRSAHNNVPASPECVASAVLRQANGTLLLVTSAPLMVYASLPVNQPVSVLVGAPVVLGAGAMGAFSSAEDLRSPGAQPRTGAAITVLPGDILPAEVPRQSAFATPVVGAGVRILASGGEVAGTIIQADNVTIPPLFPGSVDIVRGFSVTLATPGALLSSMADSGAPVVDAEGTWLGLFLRRTNGEAQCTRSLAVWQMVGA